MKKFNIIKLVYLSLLISSTLVASGSKPFIISGSVMNKPDSLIILFKEYNTLQNLQTVLDTIYVNKNGIFQAKFNYDPGIYQVDFAGYSKVNIAMEKGQYVNIKVNFSVGKDEKPVVSVTGSRDAVLVFKYDQLQKAAYNKWLHPVRKKIRLAKESGKTELIPDLSKQEQKNLVIYQNELANFAKENFGNSIALFYAAIRLNPVLHLNFMEEIAAEFNKLRPELALTKKFNIKIARYKNTAIGSPAPDIRLKNSDGIEFKLSDQKGKYVLLDIWASWCNPCRIENINYAALYKKYKKRGFQIFAVSIDTNKKQWLAASKKDKIQWINVSDLKGWGTSVALTYNINAIPANFLLDRDGNIIAKDIRGEALRNKLAQLFN